MVAAIVIFAATPVDVRKGFVFPVTLFLILIRGDDSHGRRRLEIFFLRQAERLSLSAGGMVARDLHTAATLDRDRAVNVIEPNARTAGTDLAAEIVTYILTVIDCQSKVIRNRAVDRTGPDLCARA